LAVLQLRRDDIEEDDPVESFLKHRDQEKMKRELDGGTAELECVLNICLAASLLVLTWKVR
jgi:hypothetical protein